MRIIRLLWKAIVVAIITASLAINVIMFTWSAGALALGAAFTAVTGVSSGIGKISKVSSKIARRTARGAIRNILAIPAEAIPYAGAFAVVIVTGLEIKDACETMKDLKEINPDIGSTFEEDGLEVNLDGGEFCGLTIPSIEDLKDKFDEAWQGLKKRGIDLPDSENRPSLWDSLKEKVSKFWGGDESPETAG